MIQVNYIGERKYLKKASVKKLTESVLKDNWKQKRSIPSEYKIDINVVRDKRITEINKKYLSRNNPTDVIAFAFEEGEETPHEPVPLIGQIIISIDTAKRQAKTIGHSIEKELMILLIHGLLHVAGWEEGKEIQKCQERIYKKRLGQI